ncbi:MAG: hypothetical protein ACUVRO_01300 [Armatimonadota bacterium]
MDGAFPYGSAACGKAKQFSDVDIAPVCPEPLPECRIQHRILDGTTVDVVLTSREALEVAASRQPPSPLNVSGIEWFILKSLFLGEPHSVLYDANGRITLTKHHLANAANWERDVALPWCMQWLRQDIVNGMLPGPACTQLSQRLDTAYQRAQQHHPSESGLAVAVQHAENLCAAMDAALAQRAASA